MQRLEAGLSRALTGQQPEAYEIREALALADVDIVRPEDLEISSPLAGRMSRPAAADDLRLPRAPLKPKTVGQLKASVRNIRAKAAQPVSVDAEKAERIFRLAAFLDAYEAIQADIDAARQPLD